MVVHGWPGAGTCLRTGISFATGGAAWYAALSASPGGVVPQRLARADLGAHEGSCWSSSSPCAAYDAGSAGRRPRPRPRQVRRPPDQPLGNLIHCALDSLRSRRTASKPDRCGWALRPSAGHRSAISCSSRYLLVESRTHRAEIIHPALRHLHRHILTIHGHSWTAANAALDSPRKKQARECRNHGKILWYWHPSLAYWWGLAQVIVDESIRLSLVDGSSHLRRLGGVVTITARALRPRSQIGHDGRYLDNFPRSRRQPSNHRISPGIRQKNSGRWIAPFGNSPPPIQAVHRGRVEVRAT